MARLAIFLEKTRTKYEDKLNADDRKNRRGQFTAVNVGISRGSGAKVSYVVLKLLSYLPAVFIYL